MGFFIRCSFTLLQSVLVEVLVTSESEGTSVKKTMHLYRSRSTRLQSPVNAEPQEHIWCTNTVACVKDFDACYDRGRSSFW